MWWSIVKNDEYHLGKQQKHHNWKEKRSQFQAKNKFKLVLISLVQICTQSEPKKNWLAFKKISSVPPKSDSLQVHQVNQNVTVFKGFSKLSLKLSELSSIE